MTDPQEQENILLFLLHNQAKLREELKSTIDFRARLFKMTDPVFHEDIDNEFYDTVRHYLSVSLGKTLAVSPESAMIALEMLNLKEYLK